MGLASSGKARRGPSWRLATTGHVLKGTRFHLMNITEQESSRTRTGKIGTCGRFHPCFFLVSFLLLLFTAQHGHFRLQLHVLFGSALTTKTTQCTWQQCTLQLSLLQCWHFLSSYIPCTVVCVLLKWLHLIPKSYACFTNEETDNKWRWKLPG